MSDDRKDAREKVNEIWTKGVEDGKRKQIDRMNKAQYRDELDHKAKVYDRVKATLELCQTMIKALDPTTDPEIQAQNNLISYLDLARQYALMSASDVTLEKSKVRS
jgi:hypothetical protein